MLTDVSNSRYALSQNNIIVQITSPRTIKLNLHVHNAKRPSVSAIINVQRIDRKNRMVAHKIPD
jgi:hypothetical protein